MTKFHSPVIPAQAGIQGMGLAIERGMHILAGNGNNTL